MIAVKATFDLTGGDNSNKRCFGTKPKLFRESGYFSGNRDTWKFFRETRDNSGTLQKKIGTSKEIVFHVFISVNLGKLGMKSSINENIETARAAPRLAVYTNQSETHPTGWAHGWVPHSIQPRAIFTVVQIRLLYIMLLLPH